MMPLFAIFNMGGGEMVLIFAVILLLFGAKKLPELARGLGQGIKEFKKASNEVTEELQRAAEEPPPAPPQKQLPPSTVDVGHIDSPHVETHAPLHSEGPGDASQFHTDPNHPSHPHSLPPGPA